MKYTGNLENQNSHAPQLNENTRISLYEICKFFKGLHTTAFKNMKAAYRQQTSNACTFINF